MEAPIGPLELSVMRVWWCCTSDFTGFKWMSHFWIRSVIRILYIV